MRSRERMAERHAVTRQPAEDRLLAALRRAAALGLIAPPPATRPDADCRHPTTTPDR